MRVNLRIVILSLLALLGAVSSARATPVTVQSATISGWNNSNTAPRLRLYLNKQVTTSDSKILQSGSSNGPTSSFFYIEVICSVAGKVLTIPQFVIDSTTDALVGNDATYSAYFFTSTGQPLAPYQGFTKFAVPPSPPSTTWTGLSIYNSPNPPAPPPPLVYTRDQVNAIVATAIGAGGIRTLNGISDNIQSFVIGTTGTDFNIVSAAGQHTFNFPSSSATNRGLLLAADWSTFNAKQPAGSYITGLTGDVTAAGPGSVASSVALVGGSSAANVHAAELLANAATNLNTASAIVKRDASGNFLAGQISAGSLVALTGVLTPNVAGGIPIGSAALPFSSLYIGAAATSNIQVTGTATGARVFTLPDANSNSVVPSSAAANQFATGISSGGVISYAQPAFTNISGTATAAQGGTGINSGASNGLPSINGGVWSVNAITQNGVAYGGGSNAMSFTAAPPANSLLGGNAGAPSFSQTPILNTSLTIGVNGSQTGSLLFKGGTSGTVTLQPAGAAGAWSLTLPVNSGSNGQVLQTDGTGVTVWATVAVGSPAWSSLLVPTADLSLSMTTFKSTFTQGIRADAADDWTWQDTTGNTSATGHLARFSSVGTSTLKPIAITAQGTANGVEMDATGSLNPIGSGKIAARAADITGTLGNSQLTGSGQITVSATANQTTVAGSPVALGGTVTIGTVQSIGTTSNPQFGSLGLGSAAPASGLLISPGLTFVDGTANNTIGAADFQALINSAGTSTKTWNVVRIYPTLNEIGTNNNKTVNLLLLDTLDTNTTGTTTYLIHGTHNSGADTFTVTAAGNVAAAGTLNVSGASTLTGAVTGGTYNGLTVSSSTGTLTVANGKTLTVNNTVTLAGTDSTTLTFQGTGTVVNRDTTDNLTNKTLNSTTDVLGGVTMTLGSDATGDVYYRNSSGVLTRLGVGSAGQFLGVSGGIPAWGSPSGSGTVSSGTTNQVAYYTGATTVGSAAGITINNTNQSLAIAGAAISNPAANLSALSVTGGAHTGVVNEVNDIIVPAHTITIAGGLSNERFVWLRQPTVTSSLATQTVTNASTFTIEGPPTTSAGGGFTPTLTVPLALWTQTGNVWIQGAPTVTSARVLIGSANFTNTDWLSTLRVASTAASQFASISTIGHIGVTGASRSSDIPTGGQGPIGISGWANNDLANGVAASVYGGYYESHMQNGTVASSSSASLGIEIDSINWKTSFSGSMNSYGMFPNNQTIGLWLACGGGGVYTPIIQSHLALGIVNNNKTWDRGIMFGNNALSRSGDPTGGTGTTAAIALELAQGHQIVWDDSTSTAGSQVVRGTLTSDAFTMNGITSGTGGKISGGTHASAILTLQGTNNATPSNAYVIVNPLAAGVSPGAVGIGATATSFAGGSPFIAGDVLHLQGSDSAFTSMVFDAYNAFGSVLFRAAGGSSAVPSALLSVATIGGIRAEGAVNATTFSAVTSRIVFVTTENWSPTATGTNILFETTPTGTTTKTEVARLMANGGLQISNNWSATPVAGDFVGGSKAAVIMAVHGNKLTFAYNNAGTVNYITFTLDGATTTFTNSSTAP